MSRYTDNHQIQTFIALFLRQAAAVLVAVLLIGVSQLPAKSPSFSEDQIKAVYLFNLTGFVSWPKDAFSSPDAPLRIAVSGNERVGPFIEYLRMVIKGETAGNRNIVIERLPWAADPKGFHILFVTDSPEPRVSEILASVKNRPILTVGEIEDFCRQGGMINLVRRGNRIGLEVNVTSTRASGLQVSSKLLRIATIIENEQSNGGGQ